MKVGDKIPVSIGGAVVGQAEVHETGTPGQVTLVVPMMSVVMAVRTELAPEVVAPKDTSGTETIIEEVVRTETTIVPPIVDSSAVDVSSVPDNSPEAVEFDSEAGKTVAAVAPVVETPQTLTVEGKTYRLPPGTTLADLEEPAANE